MYMSVLAEAILLRSIQVYLYAHDGIYIDSEVTDHVGAGAQTPCLCLQCDVVCKDEGVAESG